ncbi:MULTISPECIES: GNVR domain-containing protein [unclassified Pseudoalteromonas]|uniref:GNVR domain-containing protein n=1 Tax=unclassified Pseudoalteromonas TaxID=194690 RepID=UPI0025B28CB7|nr:MULTISPECIES: GNVR domain-containing protein [unclassified Pseudoalteromonas]MDN3379106.1 GNVR domain-containing protein [Pseudoalteromonas sp. APC 3893]MDN3387805.1 GNVR domain-containing protein [Pseudoalteromonas sp. APC 4017]
MVNKSHEITVGDFCKRLFSDKWLVVLITGLVSIAFVILALYLPNKYKSDVLLMPIVEQDTNLAGLGSQLGGLASMAGINLGGQSDKTDLAIATLKSRTFLMNFINENKLKVELLGVKSWDYATNQYIYDDEVYDRVNNKWVRESSTIKQAEPSLLEAYIYFMEELLEVDKDKETGFVRITIKHVSAQFAERVVTQLIISIDEKLRADAANETERSIEFLKEAIKESDNSDLKILLYNLIEQEVQKKMLTKVKENYAFKVIDKAVIAEEKYSPRRALLCIFGFILGGIISCIVVFIRALR